MSRVAGLHDCEQEAYVLRGALFCPCCGEFVGLPYDVALEADGAPLEADLEALPVGVTFDGRTGADFYFEAHWVDLPEYWDA